VRFEYCVFEQVFVILGLIGSLVGEDPEYNLTLTKFLFASSVASVNASKLSPIVLAPKSAKYFVGPR
jgi:hypothetical protein